jgi:predicted nucleic acid-binding protein
VKVFLDTTVLVASVVQHHPHHARALSVMERILVGDDQAYVAAHGLAESYAVLTTLPITPRIGPEAAKKIIEDNFVAHLSVVALTAREYVRLVSALAELGVLGGSTYDSLHLLCAKKVRAERIYTFNIAHFRRLAGEQADRIVAP